MSGVQLCRTPASPSLLSHTVVGGILAPGGPEGVHGGRDAEFVLKEEFFAGGMDMGDVATL